MDSPPGLLYLCQRVPAFLAPATFTYITVGVATKTYFALEVPKWVVLIMCSLALPVVVLVSVVYTDYMNVRNANRLGAVMPPQVRDRWPGGLSLLSKSVQYEKFGYPGDTFVDAAKAYGHTFNMRILLENRIITTEPEHIKAILATTFDEFEKGQNFFERLRTVLGTGVFNSDGEMWKFHRAMTRPFFSKDRISHFDIFGRHADDAITKLKARLTEGYAVDVQDMVSRFTLDSATEFLFGNDVCSLSAGYPYPQSSAQASSSATVHPANAFAEAFSAAQIISSSRGRWGAHWPLAEFWVDKTKKHMDIVNSFIDPILKEALEKKKRDGRKIMGDIKDREVKDGETLLDHLVHYTDDQTILKDEIMNIMIAGRDTTACTLTFAVYLLARHPDTLRRLREEILAKVGSSDRPTYDDMRDMKYLRAFINETLRLYPPVPFNVRTSKKPTVLPSKTPGGQPTYVPANTRAVYSVLLMHRRTDLWGPDAQKFDPDRFLDERLHKYLTPNPFIFLPFNAGPRICLGQQFAYNEVSFFLIRLVQNFSAITLAPDAQPASSLPPQGWAQGEGYKATEKVRPRAHLTLFAEGGVWVRMEEASPVEIV